MLTGKLALVTGGGSGIGRAACQLMAKEGARVVVSDFDLRSAEETFSTLSGEGHLPVQLDVSDTRQVRKVVETVLSHYATAPTLLVNSAGITRDAFLLKMTDEQFQQVFDVNVKGTYAVTKTVCEALAAAKTAGSIINIASVVGQTGNMGQSNYAASKAAVEAFTKSVAKEMGLCGVRCNAVVPGFIQTPMTDKVPDKVKLMFTSQIPLARMGTPQEVAEVIVFLASDRSSYINGASIKGPYKIVIQRAETCENQGSGKISFRTRITHAGKGKYLYNETFSFKVPFDENLSEHVEVQRWGNGGWQKHFGSFKMKNCEEIWKFVGRFLKDIMKSAGVTVEKCPVPAGDYKAHEWEFEFDLDDTIPIKEYGRYRGILTYYYKGELAGCVILYGEAVPKTPK